MSQRTQIIFFEHELFELHELNHSHTDADLFFEHGKPIERIKMGGRASALDSTNRITETVVGAYLRDAPARRGSPTDVTEDTDYIFEHELFELHELNHSHTDSGFIFRTRKAQKARKLSIRKSR